MSMGLTFTHHQLGIEPVHIEGGESYCSRHIEPVGIMRMHSCHQILSNTGSLEPLVRQFPSLFQCTRCNGPLLVMKSPTRAYLFFQALSVVHPVVQLSMNYCDGCDREHLFLRNIEDGAPCQCGACDMEVLVFGARLSADGDINYQAQSHDLVKEFGAPAR
jgi:hypothetical protein